MVTLFAEPRIRAHCLTAGLNRLDVNLRLSQEIQGVAAGSRNASWVLGAPLWWRPPECILGAVPRPPFLIHPRVAAQALTHDRRAPRSAEPACPFSAALSTPGRGTLKLKSLSLPFPAPSLWSHKCRSADVARPCLGPWLSPHLCPGDAWNHLSLAAVASVEQAAGAIITWLRRRDASQRRCSEEVQCRMQHSQEAGRRQLGNLRTGSFSAD